MPASRTSDVLRRMRSRGLESLPESERSLVNADSGFLGETVETLGGDCPPPCGSERDREQSLRSLLASP